MHRLLKQKGLFIAIVLTVLFFMTPTAKSFAFGIDLGQHCWTGNNTGVSIRHHVTEFAGFYNLNGRVHSPASVSNTAYGSAFFDNVSNKIKMGYTLIRTNRNDVLNVHMELTPGTLNGTKTTIASNGSVMVETVTHIPCP